MKEHWKDYFHFTKTERNGLLVLLVFCLFFFFLPRFFSFLPAPPEPDFSAFAQEVQPLLSRSPNSEKTSPITPPDSSLISDPFPFDPNTASADDLLKLGLPSKVVSNLVNYRKKGGRFFQKEDLQKIYGLSEELYQRLEGYILIPPKTNTASTNTTAKKSPPARSEPIQLRPFDPNTAGLADLQTLGLSPKTSQTILNYRNKGGTFRKKEDLKKIYGISEATYQNLEAYIQIQLTDQTPKPTNTPVDSSQKAKVYSPTVIDVNRATIEEWQKLRGIGPAFAQRIVKWRNQLGGFSHLQQIKETYGLPDSTFQNIVGQLQLSPLIKKIPINQVSLDQLKKHPYISPRQAQALLNFRNNHGNFNNWEDFSKIKVFSPEQLGRLRPYLSWE